MLIETLEIDHWNIDPCWFPMGISMGFHVDWWVNLWWNSWDGTPNWFVKHQDFIHCSLTNCGSTRWYLPSYVCWFINPSKDITSITPSYGTYKPTERYLWGTTLSRKRWVGLFHHTGDGCEILQKNKRMELKAWFSGINHRFQLVIRISQASTVSLSLLGLWQAYLSGEMGL